MSNKLSMDSKTIQTNELEIQGNIMLWKGTMLQLSNISCISTSGLSTKTFPFYSLIGILIALFLFKINTIFSLILLCLMGFWIYYWYEEKLRTQAMTSLNIMMNSGITLHILINDKEFLKKILTVLEKILADGNIGEQHISINIKDCNISGNAHVLDDLKINK